jgi:dihydrofolate reductase
MISAIFAVDDTGGMGFDGSMPWPRNKEDMKWFKSMTEGETVVMGKKTWDSTDMPIPLPGRINVLVTNVFIDREDIIQIRGELPISLKHLQQDHNLKNIFIIGGPNILIQSEPVIDKVYLTRIPGEYINDTFIDLDQFLKNFKLIRTSILNTCEIEEYERCNNT